jgi:site-specific recombinase XerD
MRADNVTTRDGEEFRDARKAAGLSPQTVNKILTTLTAIYKYANARDVTDRNPAVIAERLRTTSGEIVASTAADESEEDSLGYVPAPEEA